MRAAGYRPVFVNGHDAGGEPRLAAIARKDESAWEARLDPTPEAHQATFDDLSRRYSPVGVSGYALGDSIGFASVWGPARPSWYSYNALDKAQYQARIDEMVAQKMMPVYVSAYPAGDSPRLAAIFRPDSGAPWVARHDLTAEQFQAMFDEGRSRGQRPIGATAYPNGGVIRFALILARDRSVRDWTARPGLSSAQLRKELDDGKTKGYHPVVISGYRQDGESRYLAVWVKTSLVELPMTGPAVPQLAEFDRAMQQFMAERSIRAGTLAVMKDGRLMLGRGYGFADRGETRPIFPDAPLRLASITKVFTAATVRGLIRRGKLRAETKVFGLLEPTPPAGRELDPRWKDITVQHLLDHRGGWDSGSGFDPMFRPLEIGTALGKPGPATSRDVIAFMAGRALQFDPGSDRAYSNFGYCLLGRVIETVTGRSYLESLRAEILEPLGMGSVELGRSLPRDRNPREPYYADPAMGRNAMEPDSREPVPAPDGTFCLEAMDSHGGLIASAPDVARFLQAYGIDGQPRSGDNPGAGCFFGSLPGTFTMALGLPDGVSVVALFNQRTDPSLLSYETIRGVMEKAAGNVHRWPRGEARLPPPDGTRV
jgi:CubicO group peptidase (beta-lactamase class C family)